MPPSSPAPPIAAVSCAGYSSYGAPYGGSYRQGRMDDFTQRIQVEPAWMEAWQAYAQVRRPMTPQ